MAVAICAAPGFEVALFSVSEPFVVVVARSRDARLDASAVVRDLVTRFGGRGGGKADLAQGGGLTGNLQEMLDAATAAMTR
jgi:alanyl-tRNA synthetase